MKNNKGFTLVELLVSTAIFALISLGAATFMITGTRVYSNVNANVQLQYDSQLALSLLNEYIVDCKQGIAVNDSQDILYLVNDDQVYMFQYDADDKTIYYDKGTATETSDGVTAGKILAENVTDLDINLVGTQIGAQRVELTIEMERRDKTFRATQVTALRNQPPMGDSWAELWSKIKVETGA